MPNTDEHLIAALKRATQAAHQRQVQTGHRPDTQILDLLDDPDREILLGNGHRIGSMIDRIDLPEPIATITDVVAAIEAAETAKRRKEFLAAAHARVMSDPRRLVLGDATSLDVGQPAYSLHPQQGRTTVLPDVSSTYQQNFEYGSLTIKGIDGSGIIGGTEYYADIFIAAMKCYGSEDEGGLFSGGEGLDEPYLTVTALTIPDAFEAGAVTHTWQSPVYTGIGRGRIFAENTLVFKDLRVGRHGIDLKLFLIDQEHGSKAAVEKKIKEKAAAVAGDVRTAVSALTGVNIDEILDDQDLDSGILNILGEISLDVLSDILDDDPIEQKTWNIPAYAIKAWADTPGALEGSQIAYTDIPSHFASNYPNENPWDPTWLFSDHNGATYRLLLRVVSYRVQKYPPGTPPHQ